MHLEQTASLWFSHLNQRTAPPIPSRSNTFSAPTFSPPSVRIPLSALAVRELKGLQRGSSPLVFPSARKASAKPFSGIGKLLLRLHAASEPRRGRCMTSGGPC